MPERPAGARPPLTGDKRTPGSLLAPPTSDRVFFAVYPDHASAVGINRLAQNIRRECALTGHVLQLWRLHVTLHFLGDYAGLPQPLVASARQAAARVQAAAFEVMFDNVASFSGGRRKVYPLVLRGTAGLNALRRFQRELSTQLQGVGLRHFTRQPFHPHLTLLYDRQVLKPQSVEPIGWAVREFLLIHSLLGHTEHRVLGRWPLPSRQASPTR